MIPQNYLYYPYITTDCHFSTFLSSPKETTAGRSWAPQTRRARRVPRLRCCEIPHGKVGKNGDFSKRKLELTWFQFDLIKKTSFWFVLIENMWVHGTHGTLINSPLLCVEVWGYNVNISLRGFRELLCWPIQTRVRLVGEILSLL